MAEHCRTMREHFAALLQSKKADAGHDSLKAGTSQGTVALLKLKGAYRMLAESAEGHRNAAADTKTTYGQSSLQLHNIQYEGTHYGKEIRSCQNFKSSYTAEEIGLTPLEEFLETPAGAEFADAEKRDEHQLMLARLTHEWQQRQALVQQQEELRGRKQAMLEGLHGRRKVLAGLMGQLKSLASAAQPISASLEIQGQRLSQMDPSVELLPLPLYIIFSQAIAAQQAFGLPVTATVSGSLSEAQRYAAGEALEAVKALQGDKGAEGEEGGAHEGAGSKRQRTGSAGSSRSHAPAQQAARDVYQAHPLSVQLQLLQDKAPLVAVQFNYLPALKLVTARATSAADTAVLASLYPGDTGVDTPNSANRLLEDAGFKYSVTREDRPYRWAQHLGGMDFLPDVPTSTAAWASPDHPAAVEAGLSTYRRQQRMVHVLQQLWERKTGAAALNCP